MSFTFPSVSWTSSVSSYISCMLEKLLFFCNAHSVFSGIKSQVHAERRAYCITGRQLQGLNETGVFVTW
jgi:hypothetical protein